jgi:F-type H+-transporting ATPase subunit c
MEHIETAVNCVSQAQSYIIIAKYIGAALVMGLGAIGASTSQGRIAGKTCESIAQNINAEKSIKSIFFIGMIFVETSAIYCLLISLILLFVV